MKIENITHNHLKKILNDNFDILESGGELTEDDYAGLLMELFYSVLISPAKMVDGEYFFVLMGDDEDNQFIPLFTDLIEYRKLFANDDEVTAMFYDFDYYLEAELDLIVINPASECFTLNTQVLKDKPKTLLFPKDIGKNTLGKEEIENILNDTSINDEFSKLIDDEKSIYDFENFFKALAETNLIVRVLIEDEHEDFIDLNRYGPAPINITPEGLLELYTSRDEVANDENTYIQLANLDYFIEYLIRTDTNGMIINPESNRLVINRDVLMFNFDEFREMYDREKYAKANDFAFKL